MAFCFGNGGRHVSPSIEPRESLSALFDSFGIYEVPSFQWDEKVGDYVYSNARRQHPEDVLTRLQRYDVYSTVPMQCCHDLVWALVASLNHRNQDTTDKYHEKAQDFEDLLRDYEEEKKSRKAWKNRAEHLERGVQFLHKELRKMKGGLSLLSLIKLDNDLLRADLERSKRTIALPRQEQTTQTEVKTSLRAMEVQASVEAFNIGCQTFSSCGHQHECCEKAVQTACSFTKLASVVCWRCGKHGHYRGQCWSKGRRRCFACKKVGHIRRFCPSRHGVKPDQSLGNTGPTPIPLLSMSDLGGFQNADNTAEMFREVQGLNKPEETSPEVKETLDDIIGLVMKRFYTAQLYNAGRNLRRRQARKRKKLFEKYPKLGGKF